MQASMNNSSRIARTTKQYDEVLQSKKIGQAEVQQSGAVMIDDETKMRAILTSCFRCGDVTVLVEATL